MVVISVRDCTELNKNCDKGSTKNMSGNLQKQFYTAQMDSSANQQPVQKSAELNFRALYTEKQIGGTPNSISIVAPNHLGDLAIRKINAISESSHESRDGVAFCELISGRVPLARAVWVGASMN